MNEKREGIGLPSSLVDEAISSMNSDSQTASNSPVESMGIAGNPESVEVQVATENVHEMGDSFKEIDTNDPYRGSNVDRVSAADRRNKMDQFDSNTSFNEGLLGDVRGSTVPSMATPVLAEQIGQIDFVKWFSELNNKDVPVAGGKGASLGEMFSNKFPVPPGYVVTAQAYDYYLKSAGLKEKIDEIINSVDVDDTAVLNEASKKVRSLIEGGEIPNDLKEEVLESYKILSSEDLGEVSPGINSDALSILKNSQEPAFVSVRSSATTEDLVDASFAGQQESFLNVKGDHNLIEFLKRCFSSLYTPRAIFYRKKKGFSGALIAVVVQKMVDSEKSGVVFSRDPVKQDENIAMEAVFGLGEGIVSGKIHPDNYVVDQELEIKAIKVANKKIAIVRNSSGSNEIVKLSPEKSESQVLTRAEIKEVADFAIKLENHYEKPQDIEFALEAGEVYIIQSRPITTLGNKKEGKELSGTVLVEGLPASPGVGVGTVKIIKTMEDLVNIKKGDVMVAEMTNPDMVVSMEKSVAIVTDEGGMTSHAAIVSREMGIPAIVGCSDATSKLKDGSRVTVDGFNGKVFEGEVAETSTAEIKEVVKTTKVKMKVIVDLPDYAERAAKSKIDSVGLTRLEGMIASMGKHPLWYEKQGKLEDYSKILRDGLTKIASSFESVWVRASDIRTDEFANLEGAPEREINPMLGFHGVRFSIKHPEILKAEIAAIKGVAEKNPEKKIGLMFPQIISIEEVLEVKKYFDEFRTPNMEFGVMIETPAAVQIIEDICDHVDFISFGTNDLTQFTLAVDRGEDMVQHLYNELHPAIFSQIGHVIDVCNRKNVVSSICGQAGSKPEMAKFLYEKGIKSISVNADAAYDISVVLSELEKNEPVVETKEEEIVDKNIGNANKGTREEPVMVDLQSAPIVESPVVEVVQEGPTNDWGNKGQVSVAEIAPAIVQEPVVETADQGFNIGNSKDVGSNMVSLNNQVVGDASNVAKDNNNGELSEEERKEIVKKKKWEKFKKWKEKKKAAKLAKRLERESEEANKSNSGGVGANNVEATSVEHVSVETEPVESEPIESEPIESLSNEDKSENEKHGWGKQGEVALPDQQNQNIGNSNDGMQEGSSSEFIATENMDMNNEKQEIAEEVKQDEKQFNEEVQEENPYEDNLLSPESIAVPAETHVEEVSEDSEVEDVSFVDEEIVSKVDNLDHIKEVSKEIAEDVREENEEIIQERHEDKDRIIVEVESPAELKQDQEIENVEERMNEYVNDDVEEKTPDRYVQENVSDVHINQTLQEKEVNEKVQELVGEAESKISEHEDDEKPSPYSSEEPEVREEIEEEVKEENGRSDESEGESEGSGENNNNESETEENSEEAKNNDEDGGDSKSETEEDSTVGGDGGEEYNEIGVYNPDLNEEKSEEKSKFNYNFENWE